MEINFTGKRALVTGAGRGIGLKLVRHLVKTGASVVALDLNQTNLDTLKLELPSVVTLQVDLSDWNATKLALTPYAESIDFLVNNAGFAEIAPLEEVTEKSLDMHWNVNVKAAINITQIVAPGMKKRRSGSIVNVASVAGMLGFADHTAYGASKGALNTVTKILALELGPFNVRVNSVNPTVVWTEMAKVAWSDPAIQEKMTSKIALGRFVEPVEVVESILFLLSSRASMLNGVLLPIDGGLTSTSCP